MNKCKYCLRTYTLGVNGTVDGCDECMGVVRNALDNTIIQVDDLFVEEDSLTDMEKA